MARDPDEARAWMVRTQLIPRGIRDRRVLEAMGQVPRHRFVDALYQDRAYDDCALPIGHGQTISQPYMVALMTECLGLTGSERVLEVGTGSGYQAAVLARLAHRVFSMDRIPELVDRARRTLEELGIPNVTLRTGDGTLGWPEEAPFDAIIVTAGAPQVPQALVEQLAEGGRLVIPVGDRFAQTLEVVTRTARGMERRGVIGCVFVPLIGTNGWKARALG